MKKLTTIIALFAAIITATAAELKTLATWDFSQPLDSFAYPVKLRGDSKIENGMLMSSCADMSKASGASRSSESTKRKYLAIGFRRAVLRPPPEPVFSWDIICTHMLPAK